MKGIVVDLNDRYAVVLNKKGEFIKVRNTGKYAVGYEVDIDSKVINCNFKALSKAVSIAAGLILIFGVGMGAYAYNMPYNYINVDINPSMEFTVNIFNMVLDAEGLNSDGKEFLKKYKYKHLKIDKAVGEFIKAAVDEGYLAESNENAVMITVSGKNLNKLSDIQKEIVSAASITLEKDKVQSELVTEKITLDERNNAKELGISPGKLALIEKLQEEKPEIRVDEYKEKPVKDILTSIKQAMKDIPDKKKDPATTAKKDKKEDIKPVDDNKDKKLTGDNIKDNVAKNSQQKETTSKSTKVKDKVNKDPEPKAKIEQDIEVKDKENNKAPVDTKLDGKEPKEGVQKNTLPKDISSKDDKPKDTDSKVNEPKDSKLKDNDPKYNEPKENGPKVVELKDNEIKDNKPKVIEPKDTEIRDNEPKVNDPKENGPKAIEPKDDEIKDNEPKVVEPKGNEIKDTEPKAIEPKENETKKDEPKNKKPVDIEKDNLEQP